MDDLFRDNLKRMMDRIMYEYGSYGVCLMVLRPIGNDQRVEWVSNMPTETVMQTMKEILDGADGGFDGIVLP